MIAEILCIGTELVIGQTLNTNAQYLSRALSSLGISVYYQIAVGDNPARMRECVERALRRSDILITSGGLGPTQDDLSKEIVAETLSLPMEEDAQSLREIQAFFEKAGRQMAENNRKQARFARGAQILRNDYGTAPGCIVESAGKAVIQLPGPPRELVPMFENGVTPYLRKRLSGSIVSRYLRIFGMGESDVAVRVAELIDHQGEVTIAPYCSLGEVQLRVTALARDEREALEKLEPVVAALRERLGDVVYAVSEDPGDSLAAQAATALIQSGQTLALAESLTGGMVTSALVDRPGVSTVLLEGLVTYSNEAKERLLGVSKQTLARDGAVSEACARQMAQGLRERSGANIALSTTGIAGPGGGSPEKPVGLVYIGLATDKGTEVKKLLLTGDRTRVRTLAALHALHGLLRTIEDNKG